MTFWRDTWIWGLRGSNGPRIAPFGLDPAAVDIDTISTALANICRYGGRVPQYYSVAEHSILASHLCPYEERLYVLLHDAAEAYLGDVVAPIREWTCYSKGLAASPTFTHSYVEEKARAAIWTALGIEQPTPGAWEWVEKADRAALSVEIEHVLHDAPTAWGVKPYPYHHPPIRHLDPGLARLAWRERYAQLTDPDHAEILK